MTVKVKSDKCIGCEACISTCPFGAIEMKEGKAFVGDACTVCGACIEACPETAIEKYKDNKIDAPDLGEYKDVWIFVEHRNNEIAGVVFELLGEGRKLADQLNQNLCAVLLGKNVEGLVKELIAYGADKVYLAEDAALENIQDDPYTDVIEKMILEYKPSIFLLGATAAGRSLAPRIAARLRTGLTADCTGLEIEVKTGNLLQTRPAFGGNIMATIVCANTRPQMATVRPKVMKKSTKDDSRKGEVIKFNVSSNSLKLRTRLLEFVKEDIETVNIEDAEIIIAGGRGLGDAKNFALVEELAKLLGGAVGATRAAVDAGWIPYAHQIGQTGKTVSPKVFIACGISGAVQHLVGMQSSDIIIAINNNPDAPIFKVATYGIVGDATEVLKALIDEIKKVRG